MIGINQYFLSKDVFVYHNQSLRQTISLDILQ
nr:MAG TPA: hypothetical protein [Caudoviricetes sp.]